MSFFSQKFISSIFTVTVVPQFNLQLDIVQLSLCPAIITKVDLEEQNYNNEGPQDVVIAEVEGPRKRGSVDVLGRRAAPEVQLKLNNSWHLHSQVINKEEVLDMLGFSDAVVVEVQNILLH